MPHFGLIDDSLTQAEASLLRARLHYRGGLIRFSKGQKADGVAAFYDAMVSGMLKFFDSADFRKDLKINREDDVDDDRTLFIILQTSGVLGSTISIEDFDYLYKQMDLAIEGLLTDFDERLFMSRLNRILSDLEVIPFDMSQLPQETSVTL